MKSYIDNNGAQTTTVIAFMVLASFMQLPFALFTFSLYHTLMMIGCIAAITLILCRSWLGYGIALWIMCELLGKWIGYYFGFIFYPMLSTMYAASTMQSILIGLFAFCYVAVMEIVVISVLVLHILAIVFSVRTIWSRIHDAVNSEDKSRSLSGAVALVISVLILVGSALNLGYSFTKFNLHQYDGTLSRYAGYDRTAKWIWGWN